MDIEAIYHKIQQELAQNHRGLRTYSEEEREKLQIYLQEALNIKNWGNLNKGLCLVDHSTKNHAEFEPILLKILKSEAPATELVFALSAARKHIISAHFVQGKRLEWSFLEILKLRLYHPHAEVVEWTLRTIDECGSQGVLFLPELKKIKPAPWKLFWANQRNVRELIAFLERKWAPHGKSIW